MSTDALMMLKLLFLLAVVFGFGFYQLWSLRQDKKRTLAASHHAVEKGAHTESDRL